jgi:hypothetical protein
MRFIAIVFAISVVVGFFIAANVFRLGLEVTLERSGAVWTIISGLSLLPLALSLAFLVDTRR